MCAIRHCSAVALMRCSRQRLRAVERGGGILWSAYRATETVGVGFVVVVMVAMEEMEMVEVVMGGGGMQRRGGRRRGSRSG